MFANKIIVLLDEISAVRFQNDNEDGVCRRYFSDIGERNPGMYYSWHRVKENIVTNNDLPSLISYTIAFSNAAKRAYGKLRRVHIKENRNVLN